MSDYMVLNRIPGESLLRFLATFVTMSQGKHSNLLENTLVDLDQSGMANGLKFAQSGSTVSLYVRYNKQDKDDLAGVDLLKKLCEQDRSVFKKPIIARTIAEVDVKNKHLTGSELTRWLPNFIFTGRKRSDMDDDADSRSIPADYVEQEKVLVLLPGSVSKSGKALRDHIAEIFHDLRNFGMSVRVTGATDLILKAQSGQHISDDLEQVDHNIYIFHVKDEREHGIVQKTLNNTPTYLGCEVLDCYQPALPDNKIRRRVAIPYELEPAKDQLKELAIILENVPELYGNPAGGLQSEQSELLAALLLPRNTTGHPMVISTAYLEFVAGEFLAESWEFVEFRPVHISPVSDLRGHLEKITTEIDESQLLNRYHLQLRETHYQDTQEDNYEELQYRFHDIQDRLIELGNFGKKRPRLYRFSGKQVAALVDVIRSFPMKQISTLRYAFCSSSDAALSTENPQVQDGIHYLYVGKETALTGLDPMVWWGGRFDTPVEFWLDPYWCQHYGEGSQMELFVPHGLHLFPTINAWEPSQMDAVLTRLVESSLQRANITQAKVSHDSLLIIDRDPQIKDELLRLTALNKSDFRRLAPPQEDSRGRTDRRTNQDSDKAASASFELTHLFEWLNSYLYWYELYRGTEEVENLTITLDNLRKHDTARQIAAKADEELERLENVQQSLADEAQRLTTNLGDEINAHLSKIIAETSTAISEARVLNDRLGEIRSVHAEMLEQIDSTIQHVEQTEQAGQELHDKLARQTALIDASIQDAAHDRDGIEAKLASAVAEVQSTKHKLDQKISADLLVLDHLLKQTTEAEIAARKPRFTAYFPAEITPTQWQSLYVYVYLASAAKDVNANSPYPLSVRQSIRQSTTRSASPIPVGTLLTATPRMPGIEFNPPALTLSFYEDWHRFDFRMRAVDAPVGQTQVGFVTISCPDNGAVIADLPIMVLVSNATFRMIYLTHHATLYETVFCSYSHADLDIVKRAEAAYKALGITYLRDKTTLGSGQLWEESILSLIEQADVFQLFWSEQARTSESVANEWAYALQLVRNDKKPMTFIRPVCWVEPIAPPPPELKHLHFAYFPDLKP